MPSPDFWIDRWATGQIGFHEGVPNAFLTRFWSSAGTVLVPLCGKSADLAWLAERGCVVTGVELSPLACAAFFAERNLVPTVTPGVPFTRYEHGAITILQGDIFDLRGAFDAVWDRAALIALPPEVRPRYAAHAQSLAPRGLLVSFTYDQSKRDGPPFSVPDDEVRSLYPHAAHLLSAPVTEERWQPIGGATQSVWRLHPPTGVPPG